MIEDTLENNSPHRAVLLNKKQVAEKVGVHPGTIARLSRQGRFPPPVRLGPTMHHGVRWVKSEVDAWLADKIRERDRLSNMKGAAK